jgi:serine/threonine-protein kinase ATR
MTLLGCIPCASSGNLKIGRDQSGRIVTTSCSVCDSPQLDSLEDAAYDENIAQEAIATFSKLLVLPEFEQSRKPRVLGMIALRSFAVHFKSAELLNLDTSLLGQWCLRSLRSSMRELRITAG